VLRHLYFTSGRHYWEVLVERVADPRGVVVGVAPSEFGDIDDTVGYAATGVILHSGDEVCRAKAYAAGDTVGVFLDMNAQQVAFFLNDEAQLDPREVEGERTAGGQSLCQESVVVLVSSSYRVRLDWRLFQRGQLGRRGRRAARRLSIGFWRALVLNERPTA